MKDLYMALLQAFTNSTKINFNDLSHFIAMKGKHFDIQKCRLFLIGRAVNGWSSFTFSSADDFGQQAENIFHSPGFKWIKNDENGLHNIPKPNSNEKTYYLSKSSFWRTAKQIWERLSGDTQSRWIDYIAWNNIYKAAPSVSGNPTTNMCRYQIDICRKILKKEIDTYQPTHILFITGWNWWFDDKSNIFGVSQLFENLEHIGDNKHGNTIYVEGTAEYKSHSGNIPVVVACRPEQRNELNYVEQVIGSFELKECK